MFKEHGFENDNIPKFFNVKPSDRSSLLLQVCKRKYYFGKIGFFRTLPMNVWLIFFEHMSERCYSPGDFIYERGAVSDFFYVIAQGKVSFMMNNEEWKAYPFIRTSSYFGEIELFQETNRMWSVKAIEKIIVYALPKNDFFKLFTDPRIRRAFFEESFERLEHFNKAQRECGRELRRAKRAQDKIKKFMEKNKASIHKSVRVSKRFGEQWHNHLGVVNENYQTKLIEDKRESDTKILIQKLEMGKGEAAKPTDIGHLFGNDIESRVLLAKRRRKGFSQRKVTNEKKKKSRRQINSHRAQKSALKKRNKDMNLSEKRGMFKERRNVTFKEESDE